MIDTEVTYTASYDKCNRCFEEGLPRILYLDLFSHTFQKLLIRRGSPQNRLILSPEDLIINTEVEISPMTISWLCVILDISQNIKYMHCWTSGFHTTPKCFYQGSPILFSQLGTSSFSEEYTPRSCKKPEQTQPLSHHRRHPKTFY